MKIQDLYPSTYLKCADLQGQARRVVIESVTPEQIGEGEIKPIARFHGVPKPMVLNKTNGMMIASLFGDETTVWTGREIEIYPDKVFFQNQVTDCIRVRGVVSAAPQPAVPQAAPSPTFQTPQSLPQTVSPAAAAPIPDTAQPAGEPAPAPPELQATAAASEDANINW